MSKITVTNKIEAALRAELQAKLLDGCNCFSLAAMDAILDQNASADLFSLSEKLIDRLFSAWLNVLRKSFPNQTENDLIDREVGVSILHEYIELMDVFFLEVFKRTKKLNHHIEENVA